MVFRVDDAKQAQALRDYRLAFGAAAHVEELDERAHILHIYPGVCRCGEAA